MSNNSSNSSNSSISSNSSNSFNSDSLEQPVTKASHDFTKLLNKICNVDRKTRIEEILIRSDYSDDRDLMDAARGWGSINNMVDVLQKEDAFITKNVNKGTPLKLSFPDASVLAGAIIDLRGNTIVNYIYI